MDRASCVHFVRKMPKAVFYTRFVQGGVIKTYEFCTLMSAGLPDLTEIDKQNLCQRLMEAGLAGAAYDGDSPTFDDDLLAVAKAISARAIRLE